MDDLEDGRPERVVADGAVQRLESDGAVAGAGPLLPRSPPLRLHHRFLRGPRARRLDSVARHRLGLEPRRRQAAGERLWAGSSRGLLWLIVDCEKGSV